MYFPDRPYLRRTMVVIAAVLIAGVSTALTPLVRLFGLPGVGRPHVLWMTLSLEIVFAIYKWGVGDWSRYTPPPGGSHVSAPRNRDRLRGHHADADAAGEKPRGAHQRSL